MKQSLGKRFGKDIPQIVPDIPPEKPQMFTWGHYLIIIPAAVFIAVVGYYAGKYITLHQLSQGQLGITCQK